MIKILIVDDSTFIRKTLRQMLSYDAELEIVGEASEGREAIEKAISLKPDVITMDIIMPGVDGVWALEEIMKQRPTPVIIVSSVASVSSEIVQEAFVLGVVDIVPKPDSPSSIPIISKELIEKIKAASRIGRLRLLEYKSMAAAKKKPLANMKTHQVVVIATSAGGPPSLYEVISKFSENFYAGIIVAQHIPSNFLPSFVSHIQKMTTMSVKIAEKGDLLFSRRVLFSPTDCTLELHSTKKGAVVDLVDHKVRLQPDIDTVITSCADVFKASMALVILSGLGNDGVKGAEVVKKYGGKVIVEDKTTAGIYTGMPLSVVKSGFYDVSCPSYAISETVENLLGKKMDTISLANRLLVKGVVLRSVMSFVRTNCAADVYNSIISLLSDSAKNAVGNSLNSYNYYPVNVFIEFCDAVKKGVNKPDTNMLESVGAYAAQECFVIYKQGFPIGDVEKFVAFIPNFHKVVFPGSNWDVTLYAPEVKQVQIAYKNEQLRESTSKTMSPVLVGWIKYLFEANGVKVKDCATEIGEDSGGWYIKFTVTWN